MGLGRIRSRKVGRTPVRRSLDLSAHTVWRPAVVAVIALLVVARRYTIRDYLALKLPTARQAALAVGGQVVFIVVGYFVSFLLGRPLEPTFVVEAYRTGAHVRMFIAFVFAAAIGEEVIFRGFLYEGIASSAWGPVAAILVSAGFWALLHFSFGAYSVGAIAILGVYLGAVRFITGSLPLTMLLHALNNAGGVLRRRVPRARR